MADSTPPSSRRKTAIKAVDPLPLPDDELPVPDTNVQVPNAETTAVVPPDVKLTDHE